MFFRTINRCTVFFYVLYFSMKHQQNWSATLILFISLFTHLRSAFGCKFFFFSTSLIPFDLSLHTGWRWFKYILKHSKDKTVLKCGVLRERDTSAAVWQLKAVCSVGEGSTELPPALTVAACVFDMWLMCLQALFEACCGFVKFEPGSPLQQTYSKQECVVRMKERDQLQLWGN